MFDGNEFIGNLLGPEHVGLGLNVQVVNTCNDNFCWGTVYVLDELKPVFDCDPDTIKLLCIEDLSLVAPPTVTDNCEVDLVPYMNSETVFL